MPGFYRIITPAFQLPAVAIDSPPALAVLQETVGGYIERVPFFDCLPESAALPKDYVQPCVAYCNEEGKLNGLPVNITATRMWANVLMCAGRIETVDEIGDVLVGTIIVLWGDDAFMEAL